MIAETRSTNFERWKVDREIVKELAEKRRIKKLYVSQKS